MADSETIDDTVAPNPTTKVSTRLAGIDDCKEIKNKKKHITVIHTKSNILSPPSLNIKYTYRMLLYKCTIKRLKQVIIDKDNIIASLERHRNHYDDQMTALIAENIQLKQVISDKAV